MRYIKPLLLVAFLTASLSVMSHSGGTNSAGCHNDHKRGTYHCH